MQTGSSHPPLGTFPNATRRISRDPTTTFCPNRACPTRGQRGQGNIGIHSRKDKRCICTECHKTFAATKGTVVDRLRTPVETVALVLTLLAHGGPLQAIVVACGFDERTVVAWEARAGRQCRAGASGRAAPGPRARPSRCDPRPDPGPRLDGAGDDGPDALVARGRGQCPSRPAPAPSAHRAGASLCGPPPLVGCTDGCVAAIRAIRRRFVIRSVREPRDVPGCVPGATSASHRSSSALRSGGSSRSSDASWRHPSTGRDAAAALAQGRGDQHRLQRAALGDLS